MTDDTVMRDNPTVRLPYQGGDDEFDNIPDKSYEQEEDDEGPDTTRNQDTSAFDLK